MARIARRDLIRLLVPVTLIPLGSLLLVLLWPDEALLDGAREWLEWEPPVAEANAYPLIAAFTEGTDGEPLRFSGSQPECDFGTKGCFDRLTNDGRLAQQLATNRTLLERYRALYHTDAYWLPSTAPAESEWHNLSTVSTTHQLLLSAIALHYRLGAQQEALANLQQDIDWLRTLLANSNSLAIRELMFALYASDLQLLAALMDGEHPGPAIAMGLELQPLEKEHLKLDAALATELQRVARQVAAVEGQSGPVAAIREGDWGLLLPFQPQATLNFQYRRLSDTAEAALAPPGEVVALLEASDRALRPTLWQRLHNPVSNQFPESNPYRELLFNAHNLQGLIRLVRLKGEIRRAGIGPTDIPLFLTEHKTELGNPYSDEAMEWDSERQRLRFTSPAPSAQDSTTQLPLPYP